MSTTVPAATNGHSKQADGVRTYRGRTLEDLIPRIRAELGPDAIILREREGLMGGINGFFAQRFVEIEARAGMPRVDLYDEDPADASFASQLEHAAHVPEPATAQDPIAPAEPASEPDASAGREPLAESEPVPAPEPVADSKTIAEPEAPIAEPEATIAEPEATVAEPEAPIEIPAPTASAAPTPAQAAPAPKRQRRRPSRLLSRASSTQPAREIDATEATAVVRELMSLGVSQTWATELIGEASAHFGPFAQTSLRDAVRAAIAASLSSAAPLAASGAAVAFVGTGGAGKTRCTATLSAAYRLGSTLPVMALSIDSPRAARGLADLLKEPGVPVSSVSDARALARRVERGRAGGLVVIDTTATAPSDPSGVDALAAQLAPLDLDAVYIALPATLGAETAKRLLGSLMALGLTGIAVTHADETDQIGVAIELAASARIPISFVHEGLDMGRALSAPNPFSLAQRLLP